MIRPMLEKQLSELLPREEQVISVLNLHKVQNFKQYAEQAVLLADQHELNLLIDTDKETGSIIFADESLNFCDNQLELWFCWMDIVQNKWLNMLKY